MKKKDKLKETARPRTWIWEAYFHLSFLSSILLCCSFLFAQRNGKRHAFSFSRCLIMVLFRSALLYGASPEPCTGIAEQPVDYPDTLTEPPTTPANAPAKCTMNVTCFNKCSQRAMPRLNQQEQLLYRRHQSEQYI